MGYNIVLVTCPQADSSKIASLLVEKKLAACVNILNVHSVYRWEGKIAKEEESLLIIKTKEELFPDMEREIKLIHPYKVPEIISFKIEKGYIDYLNWIEENTASGKG
jgi:periplasmic divalent cation tolerance protein